MVLGILADAIWDIVKRFAGAGAPPQLNLHELIQLTYFVAIAGIGVFLGKNLSDDKLTEIYSDAVLTWLKENCATTCITTAENVANKLALPKKAVVSGLKKLQADELIKVKRPNAWEFTAANAAHVVAGYKRIVRR